MMATEATAEKPVDVSLTEPSSSHAISIKHDSQNVAPSASPVNGAAEEIENKQIADLVDELVHSAEVSVSGSDTEASKSRLDDKGHARNSSTVKKPQSFKSVSVNKTFLASKGATGSSSRPESAAGSASSTPAPGATGLSASKLKLVAKSASTIGGSTKALGANGKPATPGASSVWNKNQPIPTPEPKKLTDEELQSQYGIHLADRLRPEDGKGQSNWADIDDDEEWDPDTITWTDGTQITLPQADEKAISPVPAPAAAVPLATKPLDIPPKAKSPAPVTSNTSSPSIRPGVLASGKGLVLKGAPEKPTLVAKPPAPPTPVKSPWATLPPVDKAPPMVGDAPSQLANQQAAGYLRRDGLNSRTPPPPAKEIAADDFSRGPYRDGHHAASGRELYNSHSGRYEPVQDQTRRGSRNEGAYGRQPALLQRPHHDLQGPAEPSAAFQTSRTSGPEGPYGRRRGSSNVSGGSGSMAYRLDRPPHAIHPPNEFLHIRSGSMAGSADSPTSARPFSPSNSQATPRTHHSQPYQARTSPNVPHVIPHPDQPPQELVAPPAVSAPPPAPIEDELEVQKRLMRERREAAIKRRMEDEAREEEARKERIRKKLEAMGPAPERKSTKKDEKEAGSPALKDAVPAALLARTRVPVEDQAVQSPPASEEAKEEATAEPVTDSRLHANGMSTGVSSPPDSAQLGSMPPGPVAKAQSAAPWPDTSQSSDRYPSWGSGSQNNSLRNVWAAPGNDRSLGNGTFIADLGGIPDSPNTALPIGHRPAPIGPPRSANKTQPAPSTRPEPASSRLAPIGPPRTSRQQQQQQQQTAANPWKNYDPTTDDRALREEKRAKDDARLKRLAEQGVAPETLGPAMAETWRAVKVDQDGKRTQAGTTMQIHGGVAPNGTSEAIRPTQGGPASAMSKSRSSSRFFPPTRDVRLEEAEVQHNLRPRSPTPPPPTMEDHPAYEGNPDRPHVSLPRSPIVVKLPPAATRNQPAPIGPPKPAAPVSFAAAAAAPAPGRLPGQQVLGVRSPNHITQSANEIKSQENWQDKINSLMGKKPPARPTVDPSSKISIEHGFTSANVSLPSLSSASSTVSDDSFNMSREMAEECFEEQEMGSLPAVHLPTHAPEAMWQPFDPVWSPISSKYRVEPSSAEGPRFNYDFINGKTVVRISAPGMHDAKTVPYHFHVRRSSTGNNRTRSNPRRQAPRGGSGRHASRGGQRGGREGSADLPGNHSSGPTSERPSSSRGGRGGFRARSEGWGRHASPASTAQT